MRSSTSPLKRAHLRAAPQVRFTPLASSVGAHLPRGHLQRAFACGWPPSYARVLRPPPKKKHALAQQTSSSNALAPRGGGPSSVRSPRWPFRRCALAPLTLSAGACQPRRRPPPARTHPAEVAPPARVARSPHWRPPLTYAARPATASVASREILAFTLSLQAPRTQEGRIFLDVRNGITTAPKNVSRETFVSVFISRFALLMSCLRCHPSALSRASFPCIPRPFPPTPPRAPPFRARPRPASPPRASPIRPHRHPAASPTLSPFRAPPVLHLAIPPTPASPLPTPQPPNPALPRPSALAPAPRRRFPPRPPLLVHGAAPAPTSSAPPRSPAPASPAPAPPQPPPAVS